MSLATFLLPLAEPVFAVTSSYHIGNSLTFDSQPLGIQALAQSRGLDHEVGFHIRSGSSLQNILTNPEETTVDPNEYGSFSQALPNNHWDIVTIQPHPNNVPFTTLGEDLNSILSLIDLTRTNPTNANTNFYIYATWPQQAGVSYQTQWATPSIDDLTTQMSRRREYYNNLIERVRDATDANVYMVPVGEVLFELDIRMKAGEIPGFSSAFQLYRDALHLSYGPGRFIAGATTFATILGQYPNGLDIPLEFYNGPNQFNSTQQALILETIREVLDQHPYSGVKMPPPLKTDFDHNNTVNLDDFQILLHSLDVQNPHDMDGDGDVDGRDFLRWQREYSPTLSLADAANFAIADINGDGIYNAADLQQWQASYGLDDGGDVDNDGDSDGRDFLAWQRASPSNPADINHDFLIDHQELNGWQDSYGYSKVTDVNGDGITNLADFEIWLAENGRTWTFPYALSAPPLASQTSNLLALAVPEPSSALLAFLTVVLSGMRFLRLA